MYHDYHAGWMLGEDVWGLAGYSWLDSVTGTDEIEDDRHRRGLGG